MTKIFFNTVCLPKLSSLCYWCPANPKFVKFESHNVANRKNFIVQIYDAQGVKRDNWVKSKITITKEMGVNGINGNSSGLSILIERKLGNRWKLFMICGFNSVLELDVIMQFIDDIIVAIFVPTRTAIIRDWSYSEELDYWRDIIWQGREGKYWVSTLYLL